MDDAVGGWDVGSVQRGVVGFVKSSVAAIDVDADSDGKAVVQALEVLAVPQVVAVVDAFRNVVHEELFEGRHVFLVHFQLFRGNFGQSVVGRQEQGGLALGVL